MSDPIMTVTLASFALLGLSILLFAGLKGWQGWLEVRRLEIAGGRAEPPRSPAMDRIELADLKERVRKLESIAACIDL
jgi:hypothetical protein